MKTDITNKAEQQLQDMDRDHSVDEITLLFDINDKIDNITNTIETFGSVKVQTGPCELSLVTHKNKQAQSNLKGSGIKLITDVKFRLAKEVETDLQVIRGIVALPNGNYALSDYDSFSENVCVFGTEWERLGKISVKPSYAVDITFVDDKTVVVASNCSRKGSIL
ncbi:unnamed protein product [Mytilus edulis]|uniref:Uncharacterized protein n=1 Tax=Mytilus edulis TaxID=6550 RepID=A0A8S3QS01_MYTED|nr:unnamed protein product [Mytilus edulis]